MLIRDPTQLYMYEEGSPEGKRPQESAKGPGPELGPLLALITNPQTSTPTLLWTGRDVLVSPNIPTVSPKQPFHPTGLQASQAQRP